MYDYRITCDYDELLRFKKSSAVAAAKYLAEQGIISDAKHGLVQVVSDNFDTYISSTDGKALTHSLAMIVMQSTCDNHPSPDYRDSLKSVNPLKERLASSPPFTTVKRIQPCHRCPSITAVRLHHASGCIITKARCRKKDFAFFKNILTCGDCPEYDGFNTKIC